MDEFLRVLSNSQRRQILLELLDRSPQTDGGVEIPATIEDDTEESQIQLYHNHLPRLADDNYIVWDQNTDKIAKGPKFEGIRPLLEFLGDFADEMPENGV
jgi:hypothetical protein